MKQLIISVSLHSDLTPDEVRAVVIAINEALGDVPGIDNWKTTSPTGQPFEAEL